MKTACLIASTPGYNLGLDKMGNWLRRQGWEVVRAKEPYFQEADLYAFSVIFSWDVPRLIVQANWAKDQGDVWIGGPATTYLGRYIERHTGIPPHVGADPRFEEERGDYPLVRTSRGCSIGCWFCLVTRMDGGTLRLYPECSLPSGRSFAIIDDNFAETPVSHQETIIGRILKHGYHHIDLNSGIEPRSWTEGLYDRLRSLPLVAWRTALDEVEEADHVEKMLRMLTERGIRRSQIWVYVLAGGKESFDLAKWRADRILEWGGEPRIQPYKPLTWLRPKSVPFISKGWTYEQVVNLPRYYYGYYWRHMGFEEFIENQKSRRRPRIPAAPTQPALEGMGA